MQFRASRPDAEGRAKETQDFLFCQEDILVVSWFAPVFPSVERTSRQVKILKRDFGQLEQAITSVWQDQCSPNCCFSFVRPDPSFLFAQQAYFAVVSRCDAFPSRSGVLVAEINVVQENDMRVDIYATAIRSFRGISSLLNAGDRQRGRRRISSVAHSKEMSSDSVRLGDLVLIEIAPWESLEEDHVGLMQTGRADSPLIEYVLHAYGVGSWRVLSWVHFWDRRNQWSFLHKELQVCVTTPIRRQLCTAWRDYQVRPNVHILRVRPAPVHGPTFLLVPVLPEDYFVVLGKVITPGRQWIGTFLFGPVQSWTTADLFMRAVPVNLCVWDNVCTITIRGITYAWWDRLLLYEGAYALFEERTVRGFDCSSTEENSDYSDSSSGSDQSWTEDDDELDTVAFLQYGGNTATPFSQFDDHSWMQVTAIHEDAVMGYLRQTVPRPFHVVVWFHPADEIGQVCRKYVQLSLELFSPAAAQIRQVWAYVYGRRSSFIFPVRPAPMTAIGPQPHVIVTTVQGERYVPILFQYVSDTDRFRGTYILQSLTFPRVHEIFHKTVPLNGCVWNAVCTIVIPHDTGDVTYSYEQSMPVFEGMFMILSELGFDSEEDSETSTCDSSGNADESMTDSGSDDENGSFDNEHSIQQDDHEDPDDSSLMQVDFESETELQDLRSYVDVHGHLDGVVHTDSHYGVLRLSDQIAQTRDVARMYLIERMHVSADLVSSVHIWIVQGVCSHFARIAILQPNFPLSQSIVRTVSDAVGNDEFGVSMIYPTLLPLTLRALPIDLVLLTKQQSLRNQFIILVDIIFAQSFPTRNAVSCNRGDTGWTIVDALGARRDCQIGGNHCEFRMLSEPQARVWKLEQVIEVPHASSLELHIMPVMREECKGSVKAGDNTATPVDHAVLMQTTRRPIRSRLHLYLGQFSSSRISVTFWVHQRAGELAQQHPAMCDVDLQSEALLQCHDMWAMIDPTIRQIVVVDPPPVLLVLPRPHVIVYPFSDGLQIPVLCRVSVDGKYNTVSILLSIRFPPVSVASIFEVAEPQSECEGQAECYLYHHERKYLYRHDVQVQQGDFLRLYEWTRTEETTSTDCLSEGVSSSDSEAFSNTDINAPEDRPYLAPIANDTADDVFLFQMDMIQVHGEEEVLDVENRALAELRRETDWRRQANDVYRRTHLSNWGMLMTELAMASTVGRQYLPIRLFSADYAVRADIFRFDPRLQLDEVNLVYHLRLFLQDTYRWHEHVKLSAVYPVPTPYQQGGDDAICVVMELWTDDASRLQLWEFVQILLRSLKDTDGLQGCRRKSYISVLA